MRLNIMTLFAVDRFGYPYDRDEVVRIAARIGMGLCGLIAKDVKREKAYICSEYVWECLNHTGIRVEYNRKGFIALVHFARNPAMIVISRLVEVKHDALTSCNQIINEAALSQQATRHRTTTVIYVRLDTALQDAAAASSSKAVGFKADHGRSIEAVIRCR